MATTKNYYTGDGTTTAFTFVFPYLNTNHIKVKLDGIVQATTEYTLTPTSNPTTVNFNTAPTNLAQIEIYRETSLTTANNVFAAGSSVKAASLNNNQTQALYALEEQENSIEKGEIFKYANANHSAGATAPTTPNSGDTWFDSTSGRTYIYYVDTDSSQWVEATPPYNTDGSGFYSHKFKELTSTELAVEATYHQVVPSADSTTYAITTITGGKIGQLLTISGPPEWRASTDYAVGDIVHNNAGKYYKCDRAGTSHTSGGPTGGGQDIEDDGAAPDARWDYIGQAGDIVLTDTAEGVTLNGIVGGVTLDVSNGDTATLVYNGYQWLLISHGDN
tara:strand:- start:1418 stop:2416 length:999 start_codon:yes stop_codon:yes gene_type:complete